MARYAHARNNFLLGEVGPSSFARTDLEQYNQMCKTLENFTVLPSGGARKRLGTAYVASVNAAHTEVTKAKVIPYRGASANYFIVGSSGTRVDIYTTSGTLVSTATITAFTGVTAAFDWTNINYTQYGAFLIVTNGANYPLIIFLNNLNNLNANYLTHVKFIPSIVGGGSGTGFNSVFSYLSSYVPWDLENIATTDLSAITLTPSVTTGSGTLTASAAIFSTAHVGTFFRLRHTTTVGYCVVKSYTSTTVVDIDVLQTFGGTTAATAWSEAHWGRRGFPRGCTFHQERLIFAGSSGFPDRTWASQTGDLYEFSKDDPTASSSIGDNAAFYFDLSVGSGARINTLTSGKKLFANTEEEEATIREIDSTYSIGVLNTAADVETREGSYYTTPAKYNNRIMFPAAGGKNIIETVFDNDENSYKNTDLNIFADHLFALGNTSSTETVREVAWQADEKILWAITTKGNLYSCTRNPDTGAFGWSVHSLGGALSSGDPKVRSICVIRDRTNLYSEVFLLVSRTVNSGTVFYIEKIGAAPSNYQTIEDIPSRFMDCSIAATGASATSWPAIAAHLASEVVDVVADGIYIGTKTLNGSGNLTLDTAATSVAVGYAYTGNIIPTALQANSLFGSGLGQIKRTEEVTLIFDKTIGGFIGEEGGTLREIQFRDSSVAADDPTPLFTGEKTVKVEASYRTQQYMHFQHTDPLPCTVSGIVFKGLLYD